VTEEFTWPERDASKGAWFGSPELKAWVLAKMIQHRAWDEIIQGDYQTPSDTPSGHRGCLIGCTLPKGAYYPDGFGYMVPGVGFVDGTGTREDDVERLYGIPYEVGSLMERTFEHHEFDVAAEFAVASIEAIPAGMVYRREVLGELDEWQPHGVSDVLAFLETGEVEA
jgi:hypothetical protein